MSARRRPDSRLAAARYAVERDLGPLEPEDEPRASRTPDDDDPSDRGTATADQRSQYVEIAVQQAIRAGDFDRLPGAGKPLTDLGGVRDPDWWIRRKIERERLTGLGPPALTLRTEDAGLDERLDGLASEQAVREALEDFNRRVREARRQLQGGPPVVTRPREVEAEVEAWRRRSAERRSLREREAAAERQREAERRAAMTWRERWRDRRRVSPPR